MLSRREMMFGCAAMSALAATPVLACAGHAPLGMTEAGEILAATALKQIGVTTEYNGAYERIGFPDGDIDRTRGVCTDVVIRAYRDAFGIDLQRLVHEDMKKAFAAYPQNWGLSGPDSNIDHRRVPNLARFFTRKGATLPEFASLLKAGDIVTMMLPGNLPHILIVADPKLRTGFPVYIHNIGRGVELGEVLHPVTGRYRYLPV